MLKNFSKFTDENLENYSQKFGDLPIEISKFAHQNF